jgi:hypothetical protein
VAALPAIGLGGITPSTADIECAGSSRVFAVDAGTGHLAEIRSCPGSTSTLGPAVEVDSGDWRAYWTIFGMFDGNAAILYAVTPTGELWWRRQESPGAALSTSVRIADTINWRYDVVFAASPGYLELGDVGGSVRTFRHEGWATGGTAVSEVGDLIAILTGPVIIALVSGYAVGIVDGVNYRVWRDQSDSTRVDGYPSGALPAGVHAVTGDGTWLYGVDSSGGMVLLAQPWYPTCQRFNGSPWQVAAEVPGYFSRMVVPVSAEPGEPPAVAPPPPTNPLQDDPTCSGANGSPWEWQ